MDASKQPGIQIHQVVLLEAHFAHRKDVLSLPHTTPITDLPTQVEVKVLGKPGDKTVAVSVRVSTPEDASLLYSFSLEMAALVGAVPGEENLDPLEYAKAIGPSAVYPFIREALATLTSKGRFGPIWLKPLNFPALLSQVALTEKTVDAES